LDAKEIKEKGEGRRVFALSGGKSPAWSAPSKDLFPERRKKKRTRWWAHRGSKGGGELNQPSKAIWSGERRPPSHVGRLEEKKRGKKESVRGCGPDLGEEKKKRGHQKREKKPMEISVPWNGRGAKKRDGAASKNTHRIEAMGILYHTKGRAKKKRGSSASIALLSRKQGEGEKGEG